jgi:putative Mg2+ transporter-C (MgtC) family protein
MRRMALQLFRPVGLWSVRPSGLRRGATEGGMELATVDIAMRLGAAGACGILLGLNRDLHNKPIGMRTLGLVSLGAAVIGLAAVQYANLNEHPDSLSRVVQGVVQGVMAGISFIGAGVILRDMQHHRVEGLTTAATVWVAAALGVACGFGEWRTIGIALVVALALLVGVGWIEDTIGTREGSRD